MKLCRNTVAMVVLLFVIRAGALAQHEGHQPQQQQPKPQPQSQSGHAEHQATPAQPNPPQVPEEHKQHVMPGMEGMQMKSLDELLKTAPSNLLPRIGASQTRPSGPLMRLEKLEEIALTRNPTLGQAAAEIRGAQGRSLQSGLYPNPTIGYSGEEIRGGASRGGQQGVFLAQTIVLGGKLGLNRKVAQQDVRLAEIEAEEQRMRVVNAVRLAYFQTLASQEMLELDRRFVQLAQQTLAAAQRLHNIGARDSSEVLQSEIALQKSELRLKRQENQHRQVWRTLAAVVGDPLLPMATLDGDLEEVPLELDDEQLTKILITESPAARISRTAIARAEAAIQRAKREPIPDLQFRGGLQQNRELNDVRRAVGAQGFAEVGFMIPIFNRDQGNVRSARADLERAQQELNRVQLLLRERAAETVRTYEDARDTVERYRKDIIPRAERLYQTQLKAWGQMAVSYPVVLLAQQDLFDVQTEYVESLRDAQIAVVALKGFLLTDGLEAPARPGEVDMPVREINLPMSRGGMER